MKKLKEFTCTLCGNKFESTANHAKYCPDCREKKQLERVQAHRANLQSGTARRIGSEQICPKCGKTFYLRTGNQKICEDCAKVRVYPKTKTTTQKPSDLYDTIHIYVPKGEKAKLQDWVKDKGLNLNKAYNYAMQLFMEQIDRQIAEDAEKYK